MSCMPERCRSPGDRRTESGQRKTRTRSGISPRYYPVTLHGLAPPSVRVACYARPGASSAGRLDFFPHFPTITSPDIAIARRQVVSLAGLDGRSAAHNLVSARHRACSPVERPDNDTRVGRSTTLGYSCRHIVAAEHSALRARGQRGIFRTLAQADARARGAGGFNGPHDRRPPRDCL